MLSQVARKRFKTDDNTSFGKFKHVNMGNKKKKHQGIEVSIENKKSVFKFSHCRHNTLNGFLVCLDRETLSNNTWSLKLQAKEQVDSLLIAKWYTLK